MNIQGRFVCVLRTLCMLVCMCENVLPIEYGSVWLSLPWLLACSTLAPNTGKPGLCSTHMSEHGKHSLCCVSKEVQSV